MGTIVTLTGPTCAGKSTLEKLLKVKGFTPLISTTTREPRFGEKNGESYYFITKPEFEALRHNREFVESVSFNGTFYGLSKAEIEKKALFGKPMVIVVEPCGQKQIRKYALDTGHNLFSVFVNADPGVIGERFLSRFASDYASGMAASIKTYAKRLGAIIETEQDWIVEAYDNDLYDHIIHNFGPSSEDEAVSVMLRATEILGRETQSAA